MHAIDKGRPDFELIGLYEDAGVRETLKSLGSTERDLREAVGAVGYSADRVCEHLKSRLWRALRGGSTAARSDSDP